MGIYMGSQVHTSSCKVLTLSLSLDVFRSDLATWQNNLDRLIQHLNRDGLDEFC